MLNVHGREPLYNQSCTRSATFAELTAQACAISVDFRALGGAMQDAPLAQLFVSGFMGQLSVSGWPIFLRTEAVRREFCRANHRKPTVRLQGRKNSRTHCARPALERLLRAGPFFSSPRDLPRKNLQRRCYVGLTFRSLAHLAKFRHAKRNVISATFCVHLSCRPSCNFLGIDRNNLQP